MRWADAVIRNHDLLNTSHLSKPLDQGAQKSLNYMAIFRIVSMQNCHQFTLCDNSSICSSVLNGLLARARYLDTQVVYYTSCLHKVCF